MKHMIRKYKETYFGNYFRKHISTTVLSFSGNLCIAFGKFLLGIIASSYWFIITACYYLTLSVTKGHLIYCNSKIIDIEEKDKNYDKQFRIYHRSGYFFVAIGLSYLSLCIWMYFNNQKSTYPEYILYGVAAIAFYKIGNAIYGLFQIKRKKNPILSVIKILGMIEASVSIVSVQCVLLTMRQSKYASSSSALFGMVISILFVSVGIYMVKKQFT